MFFIEKVRFNNFRQYRKSEKTFVEFSYDEVNRKNVNLVEGTSGSGKSNFLAGLLWCFYGDEGRGTSEQFILLNRLTSDELEEGEQVEVSVEIEINTDGDRYLVKRSRNFKKNQGEIIPLTTGDSKAGTKFEIFALEQQNTDVENNPESFVNILMPQKMKEYFFFDGEKLENYFESTGHRKIRSAVFNVSQLSVVDRIINISQELEGKYKRELNRMPGADDGIAKEIDNITATISQSEREIKEYEESYNKLSEKLQKIIDEYNNTGGDVTNNLLRERQEIEEKIVAHKEQLKEKRSILNKELVVASPAIVGIDILKKTQEILREAERNKLIPPNVRPEFLDDLINQGSCMCGAKLGGDNEAQKRLEELNRLKAEIPKISSNTQSIMQVWASINQIVDSLSILSPKINTISEDIEIIKSENKNLITRKDKIDTEVSVQTSGLGNKDFKTHIREITDEISAIKQKLFEKKRVLEEQREKESELMRKQQKLIEVSKEARVLKTRIDSIQNLILIAKNIQEKIMEETRVEISSHTKLFLKQMMEGIENVDEIEIDINDEYELMCRVDNHDMISGFSKGQKATLAISFLMALNKFSGFETPIVFDSVLGRLGKEMRYNFAKNVPKVLSSRQLIFLFLDTEFDEVVKSEISPMVNSRYKIKRKSSSEQFVTESELVKQT